MTNRNYKYMSGEGRGHIKAWVKGVPIEEGAKGQLQRVAGLPFIHKHVAVMPDVHIGIGATVGSVIPTRGAIIPAAVGVDIGCGMMAQRLTIKADQLPDSLGHIRDAIEKAVPHGRTSFDHKSDRGSWGEIPKGVELNWKLVLAEYEAILEKHPKARSKNAAHQLGTLGTGNHFIELCIDEEDYVWVMLHSGSRGAGNTIGRYFINAAKEEMARYFIHLPDEDLSYLVEGSTVFDDYIKALNWAQNYARINREIMMESTLHALRQHLPPFDITMAAINCHHNYAERERHFDANVWVTRKGAVRARETDLGIIPGSMGARSFIVRGKGNPESFCSCSHGAGRVMSRKEAQRRFTVDDHIAATEGVECRKDDSVIDETPGAYKDIELVMSAQSDLVEIIHTLKQVVCVKG